MEEGQAQAEWPLTPSHRLAENPDEDEEGTWTLGDVRGSSHHGHICTAQPGPIPWHGHMGLNNPMGRIWEMFWSPFQQPGVICEDEGSSGLRVWKRREAGGKGRFYY